MLIIINNNPIAPNHFTVDFKACKSDPYSTFKNQPSCYNSEQSYGQFSLPCITSPTMQRPYKFLPFLTSPQAQCSSPNPYSSATQSFINTLKSYAPYPINYQESTNPAAPCTSPYTPKIPSLMPSCTPSCTSSCTQQSSSSCSSPSATPFTYNCLSSCSDDLPCGPSIPCNPSTSTPFCNLPDFQKMIPVPLQSCNRPSTYCSTPANAPCSPTGSGFASSYASSLNYDSSSSQSDNFKK